MLYVVLKCMSIRRWCTTKKKKKNMHSGVLSLITTWPEMYKTDPYVHIDANKGQTSLH